MLAFYGCAIQFPRYNSQVGGKQWKTIKVLHSYRTPDVLRHFPQRNTTTELARALQHVPTKLKWPKGGMVSSRFTSAPCLEETRAFEAAASRAAGTPVQIRTLYLHNDSYRCSAPERLLTREGADDGYWQTFLCVKRSVVDLDVEYVARCVVMPSPTEQEMRDLQTVLDCLSLTRQSDPGFHVVMYEAA